VYKRQPGNVDGPDSELPGRAGWTWYTGSAAWLNRVCIEHIIGARATWQGLVIDPVPFPELGHVQATRQYRGKTIHISFNAADYNRDNTPTLLINGQPHQGPITQDLLASLDTNINVQVTWDAAPTTTQESKPEQQVVAAK